MLKTKKKLKEKTPTKQLIKKRRNPEFRIFKFGELEYIKLSDFIKEFNVQAKKILHKEDFGYYDLEYEIENILKYQLGSNNVGIGLVNFLYITDFNRYMKEGLISRFDYSGYGSKMISILEKTNKSIPKSIFWIDTGN